MAVEKTVTPVSFAEVARTFAGIGLLSFGGPAGQIAMMHRILVEEKRWLDERRYLGALNFCMLLPGPEAMQLATYAGWSLHGWRGGLAAGLLFVLPGAAVVMALSMLYQAYGQTVWLAALFFGVKAAVLAIVIEALLRVARRALKGGLDWVIAAAAFLALYAFDAPFPLVIAAAALVGFFRTGASPEPHRASAPLPIAGPALTATLWGGLWAVPVAALILGLGPSHVLSEIAWFFSKLAVVTFGGAYSVLSYMAQQAVETKGWLTAGEMADGLGLAETTPGPLILVTQFVGYLAGYRQAGGVWGGLAGAAVTLWVTFVPCFLWILSFAPYIERLERLPRLSRALAAVTAAVVGVILNLSLWFGLHVLFGVVTRPDGWFRPWWPALPTVDPAAVTLSVIAALALLKFHQGVGRTLALTAGLGLVWKLAVA